MKTVKEYCTSVGRSAAIVYKVEGELHPKDDDNAFEVAGMVEEQAVKLGFKIGPLCMDEPRAMSAKADYIAKWWNIPPSDYPKMDGMAVCDDWRNGTEAMIIIFRREQDEQV